jgi:hypothetical protein
VPKNNETNRLKLAETVVKRADLNETIEMAIYGCVDLYKADEDKFREDWKEVFGNDD